MVSPPKTHNPWIKCIVLKPNARLRLFCFHYAGGNAFVFRSWANQTLDNIDIYAIELPGHGTRLTEPAFDRMDPLVQALKTALLPYLSEQPLTLNPPFMICQQPISLTRCAATMARQK